MSDESADKAEAPETGRGQTVLVAGWACVVVGLTLMAVILLIPFASLFFLAAIGLGIAAILKRRVTAGLILAGAAVALPLMVAGILATAFVGFSHSVAVQSVKPVTAVAGTSAAGGSVSGPAAPEVPALELAAVLTELDSLGGAYRAASTSAQKEEMRKQARDKALALLQGRQMVLRTAVKDVRISSEGAVTLVLQDFNIGAYGQDAKKELRVGFPGKLPVSLSREEALRIPAGAALELRGTPVFRTARGSVVLDGLSRGSDLVVLGFSGDMKELGRLRLEPYQLQVKK